MKRKSNQKPPVEFKKNAEEILQETFGSNLKALREKKDFSQETMAFITGLSRSYYAEVETGKRNLSLVNISRILIAANIEFAELLPLSDLKKLVK
jgi:transcriptional regulator with XRE-family HTH domain